MSYFYPKKERKIDRMKHVKFSFQPHSHFGSCNCPKRTLKRS